MARRYLYREHQEPLLNLPGALRAPAGPFTIRVLGWLHLSAAEHTRTLVSLATSRTSTNAVHPAVRP